MRIFGLLIILAVAACGQSVLTSTDLGAPTSGQGACGPNDAGTIYSLPRAYIPLTLQYGKSVFKPTNPQIAAIAKLDAEIKGFEEALKKATPTQIVALNKLISEKKAERKAIKAMATGPGFKVTAGKPVYYPDPERTYRLCYKRSAGADDEIEIKTTSSGLLTSIAVSSDDRVDDVLRKLTEGVVEIAKLGAFGGARVTAPDTGRMAGAFLADCTIKDYDFTVLIDPANESRSVEVIGAELARRDVPEGCITFKSESREMVGSTGPASLTPEQATALCTQGACYRRAWPTVFTISEHSTASGASFLAELPNHGPVGVVDFRRATFVKIEAAADFENGMLTRVKYVKPSEALAIASLPVDILKSIVSIPAAIFDTQASQVRAKAKLLEAQGALIAAERGVGPASTADVTALQNEIAILQLTAQRDSLLKVQAAQADAAN